MTKRSRLIVVLAVSLLGLIPIANVVASSPSCALEWVSNAPRSYQSETRVFSPDGMELVVIRQHGRAVEVAYGDERVANHEFSTASIVDFHSKLVKRFEVSDQRARMTAALSSLGCPTLPTGVPWVDTGTSDGYTYFSYYDAASFCSYIEIRGVGGVKYRVTKKVSAVLAVVGLEPPYGWSPATARSYYRSLCRGLHFTKETAPAGDPSGAAPVYDAGHQHFPVKIDVARKRKFWTLRFSAHSWPFHVVATLQ